MKVKKIVFLKILKFDVIYRFLNIHNSNWMVDNVEVFQEKSIFGNKTIFFRNFRFILLQKFSSYQYFSINLRVLINSQNSVLIEIYIK